MMDPEFYPAYALLLGGVLSVIVVIGLMVVGSQRMSSKFLQLLAWAFIAITLLMYLLLVFFVSGVFPSCNDHYWCVGLGLAVVTIMGMQPLSWGVGLWATSHLARREKDSIHILTRLTPVTGFVIYAVQFMWA